MHKPALFLTALLSVVIIATATVQTTLSLPRVVAQVALKNQTAAIPTTTIFTPQRNGLYRISAYMSTTVPGGGGAWSLAVGWTDEAGVELNPQVYSLRSNATPPNAYTGGITPEQATTWTLRATANTPITCAVTNDNPNGTYEIFFTVEQIQ